LVHFLDLLDRLKFLIIKSVQSRGKIIMIFYQKPKYAKIEEELDNISYSAALKWLKIPFYSIS